MLGGEAQGFSQEAVNKIAPKAVALSDLETDVEKVCCKLLTKFCFAIFMEASGGVKFWWSQPGAGASPPLAPHFQPAGAGAPVAPPVAGG